MCFLSAGAAAAATTATQNMSGLIASAATATAALAAPAVAAAAPAATTAVPLIAQESDVACLGTVAAASTVADQERSYSADTNCTITKDPMLLQFLLDTRDELPSREKSGKWKPGNGVQQLLGQPTQWHKWNSFIKSMPDPTLHQGNLIVFVAHVL